MKARAFLGLALLVAPGLAGAEEVATGLRPWPDYRTILWMGGSVAKHQERWPVLFTRLRELGITTAMVGRDGDPRPFLAAGFGYYVENIIGTGLCLKFRSSVTNWNQFITEWSRTRDERAFVRDYSFDDPAWRESAFATMRQTARRHAAFAPLAYDLRDELSVTVSANPFDYDFSPTALAGFREWLKTQYGTLAQLNAQWATDFPSWDAVVPFSTDRIKARMVTGERLPPGPPDWSALQRLQFDPAAAARTPTRWNFAPWCDHRTYMDISLARTLHDLRLEARRHDPQTPVGIEGTQMPHAFGGYDLWRLSQAVDWMEPYDVGNAREILASFMPGQPLLSTVFEHEAQAAQRRLWHLLLLGDRGCIIWWSEDVIDWAQPDLPLTAKGKALAGVMAQLTSPLAKLFLRAEREYDPIAVHYSQPSIQVAWLLESTVDGQTWPRRFSSHEATHNRHARERNGWLKTLQDAGFSPRIVSSDQLCTLSRQTTGPRAIILPDSAALGDAELRQLTALSATPGGMVLKSGVVGFFDDHGSPRAAPTAPRLAFRDQLGGVFAVTEPPPGDAATRASFTPESDRVAPGRPRTDRIADYPVRRLLFGGGVSPLPGEIARHLARVQIRPAVRVDPAARVLTHRYRLGAARLLAFERNLEWQMSEELKQAGGNAALEQPLTFTAAWEDPAEVVELPSGRRLGRTNRIEVRLDPWRPSLYALLPAPVEGEVVAELLLSSESPAQPAARAGRSIPASRGNTPRPE